VPELVVALETVDYKTIAVTHGLLLALFDLLSTLIEVSTSTQVDIQYAGQLMLATLSKVIENVKVSDALYSTFSAPLTHWVHSLTPELPTILFECLPYSILCEVSLEVSDPFFISLHTKRYHMM
jgi:hypothetical protein